MPSQLKIFGDEITLFSGVSICEWVCASRKHCGHHNSTSGSATVEIARDVDVGAHSESLEFCNVSAVYNLRPLNAYLRIYLLLLAFISSRSLQSSIPQLSFRWNWKKMAGSRWTCFDVRVPRRTDYPTINLNLHWSPPYYHNAHPSQTDRQTNIMGIARKLVLWTHHVLKTNKGNFTQFRS